MLKLPTGIVAFLFTDVEGSTRLLHELGPEGYAEALAEHRRLLREAFDRHGGVEIDTQGDAFFVAFRSNENGVAAAEEAQRALSDGPIRVRMGLHTGTPHITAEGYVGADVHLGARIAAAAHGGQVLLSAATRDAVVDAAARREIDLLDLGEHRLKDFDRPVGIYQLGTQSFPPLRTISNTNLPRPASSFVGRELEVADVVGRLRDGTRLLTLTGPGGSGKTRLAIEAASELVPDFKAGVFWVGLAALRDPALVMPTIARTLGAREQLATYVADREMLLVVDNLEQVVAAAPDLASIVEACPNLRLLATSRERLRVRGEIELPVPPLADDAAIRLFADRSGLEPTDPDIDGLVRALDNLPLAVELAAARTSVLSPAEIRARLVNRLDLLKGGRDADPRQRTLRATMEWSHDLLEPVEQGLFARLSIFRGGWTLQAAEAVAGADLGTLEALVDKNLARRREGRFTMLETIREFAAEWLDASGERPGVARQHADHFVGLGEEAEAHVRADEPDWVDLLERDHDNLRTALEELELAGDTQAVLRLAGALSRFWYLHGHLTEGQSRLERALEVDQAPTAARARALVGLAVLALNLGDLGRARSLAEQSLALYSSLGDRWGTAYASFMVANAMAESRELTEAAPLLDEAIARFTDIGEEHYALIAKSSVAWVVGELGDSKREREIHEEVLEAARGSGSRRLEAESLAQLATVARNDGRLEEATAMLEQSLGIWRQLGNTIEIAVDLGRLASILVLRDRPVVAARLLAKSEAMMADLGSTFAWAIERNEKTHELLRARLMPQELGQATIEGKALTTDEAIALGVSEP